jgi:hypothetical protein
MMKQIDLFTPIVPEAERHPNFKNVMQPVRAAERMELVRWADGFPDRDNKFAKEFQTTFNSSFWEIYLHAVFRAYGYAMDWSYPSPDFLVTSPYGEIVVEATTANATAGKVAEWERSQPISENVRNQNFWPLNKEAMIRLANAIRGKAIAYESKYSKLTHVKRKPFVIAVAPFEQPDFQYQYDRPIQAVLYDYYVDEVAYHKHPDLYPDGPPGVKLGFVEKDNGTQVPLGMFQSEEYSDVSAIIFSCTATWGKVDALTKGSQIECNIIATWGGKPNGKPYATQRPRAAHMETLEDGLQVFHNPFASNPLDLRIFRRAGVVQHYICANRRVWVCEEQDNCLHTRMVQNFVFHDPIPAGEPEEDRPLSR